MADLFVISHSSNNETLTKSLCEDTEKLSTLGEASQHFAESENFILKAPPSNSKLILQNMEEVLNSVKKKHRQKHRRKREQRKLALLAELAKSPADANKSTTEVDVNKIKKCTSASEAQRKMTESSKKQKCSKQPLQEQQVIENSRSRSKRRKTNISPVKGSPHLLESDAKLGSMLQHVVRTPKKSDAEVANPDLPLDAKKTDETKDKFSTKQSTNAFEVMMNARNKTIGSNTPGKEPSILDASPGIGNSEKSDAKAKRKSMLQSWADKKGALKRKLDEEMRSSYIEDQLEKRSKRLKKMLTTDDSPQKNSKDKPKRPSKTIATRSLRLVSAESIESIAKPQTVIDPETENFLSKLSSPTKKRDSLLGYFSKVVSPKEVVDKLANPEAIEVAKHEKSKSTEMAVPQRRNRSSTKKRETIINFDDSEMVNTPETPSGRPKRSCAGKSKYDYDLEVSPKKTLRTPKSRKGKDDIDVNEITLKASRRKSNYKLENDVINLDDTLSPKDSDGTPKKLAPLFMRNVRKPNPDPQILKARQEFLRSGVPEKLKIEQEKQKQIERNYEDSIEIYPKLSHLRQWSDIDHQLVYKLASSDVSYIMKTLNKSLETLKSTESPKVSLTNCVVQDFRVVPRNDKNQSFPLLPIIGNKHQIVKTWKTKFERFPTYKCYNQLRAKYRFFSALDSGQDTTQVSESFVVTRSSRRSTELTLEGDINPPDTAPNGELLYVEKYKPMLFEQVLVNLTPVTQLREFLANWANGSGASSTKNSQSFADDSVDFLNDSSSSQQTTCNSVVLLGPTASGKTNAVYALANELNFNVLEINAGMKRTGKKLIQELQEATQSHQIRKDSKERGGTVKSKAQKSLLRLSLNDLKAKKPIGQNCDGVDASNDLAARKCLILIEDADIVFEQTDAGFTDAIYSLAASSKRPVIVVATDPNCAHLQRLINQNTIRFLPPNPLSITKYLAVLSLMENCPVSLDDLISLFLFNRQDLRKTLNELQFFIQSGGDRKVDQEQKTPKNRKVSNSVANSVTCTDKIATAKYFASPSKRRFSEDTQSLLGAENDEKLKSEVRSKRQNNETDGICIHQKLFELYTVDQNEKSRIPYPLDFSLFWLNLPDIFSVAKNLKPTVLSNSTETSQKTRSPKKTWLSSATAIEKRDSVNCKGQISSKSLNSLSAFYENASVSSLLTDRVDCVNYPATESQQHNDRLRSNLSEIIAHDMLERAIYINLDAEPCPYNLFDKPKKTHALYDFLGAPLALHGKRARSADIEPLLRAICRSEKLRATQERKSTRFYHYLRNSCIDSCNFSQQPFDSVCNVLQEDFDSGIQTQLNQ